MRKKHLYLAAGVIWGIPGVIISIKGIDAYRIQPSGLSLNGIFLND